MQCRAQQQTHMSGLGHLISTPLPVFSQSPLPPPPFTDLSNLDETLRDQPTDGAVSLTNTEAIMRHYLAVFSQDPTNAMQLEFHIRDQDMALKFNANSEVLLELKAHAVERS